MVWSQSGLPTGAKLGKPPHRFILASDSGSNIWKGVSIKLYQRLRASGFWDTLAALANNLLAQETLVLCHCRILGVHRFEFATSVIDFHLPVDSALSRVDVGRPRGRFGLESLLIRKAPS